MIDEFSFGIIALKKIEGVWHVLLVQQHGKYWSFPKGHAEGDETAIATAKRELEEETGLRVKELLFEEPLIENYTFFREAQVKKQVLYFLALVEGTLKLQHEEILDAKWVTFADALEQLTYPGSKAICIQAKTKIFNET